MNLPKESDVIWKLLQLLVPAVVAMIMFFLGQYATTWKEKRKERKRLKDVKEYFYICLLRFKIGVERQIQIFEKASLSFSEDLKKSITTNREVTRQAEASPSQILSISRNDVFKFFIQNKKKDKHNRIKVFTFFYALIEVTEFYNNKIEEGYFNYLGNYNKNIAIMEKQVNEIIDKLMKATHNKVFEGKMSAFYEELILIHNKYAELNKRTPDALQDNLLIPFHSKCIEFAEHPDSFSIILLTQYSEVAYQALLSDKGEFNLHMQKWMKQYKSMLNQVNKMIELEFKDMKYNEGILETGKT